MDRLTETSKTASAFPLQRQKAHATPWHKNRHRKKNKSLRSLSENKQETVAQVITCFLILFSDFRFVFSRKVLLPSQAVISADIRLAYPPNLPRKTQASCKEKNKIRLIGLIRLIKQSFISEKVTRYLFLLFSFSHFSLPSHIFARAQKLHNFYQKIHSIFSAR